MNRMTTSCSGLVLGAISIFGFAQIAQADIDLAFLEIQGTPAEIDAGYTWLGGGSGTLLGLVNTIDTLAYDREFEGIVIRLKDAYLSMTQVEEISRAIKRYQSMGKKVHVYAESYSTNLLALGSIADESILQSGGYVSFPGLHMEEMYLGDTYSWVGISPQLVQVGDYKGANETATRSGPSAQWDENISGLLDGMYRNIRTKFLEGRDMDNTELDEAMEIVWSASGEQAIEAGMLDAEVDLPDLKEHLSEMYGEEVNWVMNPYEVKGGGGFEISSVLDLFGGLEEESETIHIDHPTIAVVHIQGTIIDGDSTSGGLFGGGSSVGSRTIRNTIETIRKQELIKGVIIRVNSPGGSAIASEVMWQGFRQLSHEKPVWVSVGSMAASGGYYVLSAGEKVYVNESSVVGSIGVVGGKYAMNDLYEKAKINIVERSRGPMGGMYSSSTPWDENQIKIIREQMTRTYDLFTSRVLEGREGIDLNETAEGRLFVGSDAIELKMADEIGGLDDAINGLAVKVKLGDFDVVHYPQPESFDRMILEMLDQLVQSPEVTLGGIQFEGILRSLLGDYRYDAIVDSLNGLALLRDERVLLMNPKVIIVK